MRIKKIGLSIMTAIALLINQGLNAGVVKASGVSSVIMAKTFLIASSYMANIDSNKDDAINVFDLIYVKKKSLGTQNNTVPAETQPPETTTEPPQTTPVETTIPSSKTIANVTPIYQYPELPTGCEATALTVVLNWYGFNVSKVTIASSYMPQTGFYYANGVRYGPDYMTTFPGNPLSGSGYGCYAPCIAQTANNYFAAIGSNYSASNISGTSFDDLLKYTAKDVPIVFNATMGLSGTSAGDSWYTPDGRYITWMKNEHALVLIGYNLAADTVTVADPMRTEGIVTYSLSRIREVYDMMGRSAVIINKGTVMSSPPPRTPTSNAPELVNGCVFCLRNAGSGRYLNVNNGIDANNTNVYQWAKDGSPEQSFKLDYEPSTDSYRIRVMCSSGGTNRVLDIVKSNGSVVSGCNVQIYTAVDPAAQEWKIINAGNSLYKIVSRSNTNAALTVCGTGNGTGSGASPSSEGNVYVSDYTGAASQLWVIE